MPLKVKNLKSQLLDDGQNEKLFSLVGHRCSSLSSAVAQLSSTESGVDQSVKCSTVACLIKDFNKRSYFIRIFDLNANELSFEINLLDVCNYKETDLLHHVIVGKTKTFRLNFKSKVESVPFYDKVHEILSKKRSKSTGNTSNDKVIKKGTVEISAPLNFVHINHVGWNEQLSKFETSNPQSDSAISPYQIVNRQFALCKAENEAAVRKKQGKNLLYTNEEFSIYNKAEIVSIFNNEFLNKFGHFETICIKSIDLPPPPPLPR